MEDTQQPKTQNAQPEVDDSQLTEGENTSAHSQTLQQLQQELEQARQAQEQALTQSQRALADYANLKKRFDKERLELSKFASEMALLQLLPAIDNLERAVSFATDEDKKNSIVMGVVMTLQQLDEVLNSMGLVRFEVNPGDTFDPHRHEAVESVAGPAGKIIEIVEAGYTLHDKVVRPAKVKVGSGQQ
jgi:molecular chaperone GrpE